MFLRSGRAGRVTSTTKGQLCPLLHLKILWMQYYSQFLFCRNFSDLFFCTLCPRQGTTVMLLSIITVLPKNTWMSNSNTWILSHAVGWICISVLTIYIYVARPFSETFETWPSYDINLIFVLPPNRGATSPWDLALVSIYTFLNQFNNSHSATRLEQTFASVVTASFQVLSIFFFNPFSTAARFMSLSVTLLFAFTFWVMFPRHFSFWKIQRPQPLVNGSYSYSQQDM